MNILLCEIFCGIAVLFQPPPLTAEFRKKRIKQHSSDAPDDKRGKCGLEWVFALKKLSGAVLNDAGNATDSPCDNECFEVARHIIHSFHYRTKNRISAPHATMIRPQMLPVALKTIMAASGPIISIAILIIFLMCAVSFGLTIKFSGRLFAPLERLVGRSRYCGRQSE